MVVACLEIDRVESGVFLEDSAETCGGTRVEQLANDALLPHMSRDARDETAHPTHGAPGRGRLSPSERGEGIRGEHRASDAPILNPSPLITGHSPLAIGHSPPLDQHRASDAPILNPTCDARQKTRVKCLAGVAGKPLEWVWDRVVPRGKLTLITGESGAGKSSFVLDVVAAVTRGDGAGLSISAESHERATSGAVCDNDHPQGNGVLLLSAGDCWEDTVIPRLNAAQADMSHVFTLSDDDQFSADDEANTDKSVEDAWRFQLTRDMRLLEKELRNLKDQGVEVRLIVIDPIDRYLPTAFRKSDVTSAVNRLTEVAERWNAAVIVVANSKPSRVGETGLRSGTLGNPILANAARSVWMVAQDLEIEDRRLLIPLKTNLCKNPNALTFVIRDGVVDWNSERVAISGDDYFTQSKEKLRNPLVREEISEVSRVTNWLREKLQDGPVPSLTIRQDAFDHDIAYSTLRCAFRRLSCVSVKTWFANNWRWIWRMPGNPESRAVYDFEGAITYETVCAEMQAAAAT